MGALMSWELLEAYFFHTVFDLLAVSLALLSGWLVYRWRFQDSLEETASRLGGGYFISLSLGSITGAYFLGTANLFLSGVSEIGRSILGGLLGATVMVEAYKWRRGIKGSTGYLYVVPFTVCIIVGRIGCLLSGLHDQTHGVPTGMAWGWDFGDEVLRHPVQLYESLSMLLFLVCVLAILKWMPSVIIRYGFYLCVGFYAFQRFFWEFLKPYGELVGSLNIFHYACLVLVCYSTIMIWKAPNDFNRT